MRAGKNIKGSLEISAVRFMTLSKECPLSDAELSWGLLAIKRISFILNGISFVVRSLVSALSFCTVLLQY